MNNPVPRVPDADVDVVVIGGGFYGCAIAVHLARQHKARRILLVEREAALLKRASYNNQARVHNGYHYPRNFATAFRSRVNLPHFVRDWSAAICKDFTTIYAIARQNSRVTARQFQRFCAEIGVGLEPVDKSLRQLFEPRLVEEVFLAQEYVFNADELARCMTQELSACGVEVRLETTAGKILPAEDNRLQVTLSGERRDAATVTSRFVFNCTYCGLNQLGGAFPGSATQLKQEIAEMALLQLPPVLSGLGITVMDGPFFSLMPFPARSLHTLSHVRYTPHLNWQDEPSLDPYAKLRDYARDSRASRMLRDTARFIPAISEACYVDSLFEVKTVLVKNEGNDGRPILFESHAELPGCYSVLGGKIDNIYDVLERVSRLDMNLGD